MKHAKKKGSSGSVKRRKSPPAAKDRKQDSADIERAVYDGMQDLRAKKPTG